MEQHQAHLALLGAHPGEHRHAALVEQHPGGQAGHRIPVSGQADPLLALMNRLVHGIESARQPGELIATGTDHRLVLPLPGDELASSPIERQDALADRSGGCTDRENSAQGDASQGERHDQPVLLEQSGCAGIGGGDRTDKGHVLERLEPDQANRVRRVARIHGAAPDIGRAHPVEEPPLLARRRIRAQPQDAAAARGHPRQRDLHTRRFGKPSCQPRVDRQLEGADHVGTGLGDHLDPGRALPVEDEPGCPPGVARGRGQRREIGRTAEVHALAPLHHRTAAEADPAPRGTRSRDGSFQPLGRDRRTRRIEGFLQHRARHREVADHARPLAPQAGFGAFAPFLPHDGPGRLQSKARQQERDGRHRDREDGDQRNQANTQGHYGTRPPQAGRSHHPTPTSCIWVMMPPCPASEGPQRTDGSCRNTGGAGAWPPVDRRR